MSSFQPTLREEEYYSKGYKEGYLKGLQAHIDHMKLCPHDLKKTMCDFCFNKLKEKD
ncbi:MAG TPA: hypothetical protein VN704_04790 [Verrucomicrobiae bacterium]|nr:hypothetical protein [Verrucomicrobiae bacterium]